MLRLHVSPLVCDTLDDFAISRYVRFDTRVAATDVRNPRSILLQVTHRWSRPNQLFMPHIRMIDFVPWPAFRELAVQIPAMQERMEWLMDMSNTLRCDWSLPTEKAFRRVDETGLLDLCPLAKVRKTQQHRQFAS